MIDKAAKTNYIIKIAKDVFEEFKRSSHKHLPNKCNVGEFLDTGISVACTFMSVILGDIQLKAGDNIDMVSLMNNISTNIMLKLEAMKTDKELIH